VTRLLILDACVQFWIMLMAGEHREQMVNSSGYVWTVPYMEIRR
jgi:hypothetical protein